MTKKLEYALPIYYCRIKKMAIEKDIGWESQKTRFDGGNKASSECDLNPVPDCRRCDLRKEGEWVINYG
jgi:hypothetical protein